MKRIHAIPFGTAVGLLWAIYVFFAGLLAMTGWSLSLVNSLGSLYIGYSASILGAIVGAIWAFVDGFVAGAFIAWVYNKLVK